MPPGTLPVGVKSRERKAELETSATVTRAVLVGAFVMLSTVMLLALFDATVTFAGHVIWNCPALWLRSDCQKMPIYLLPTVGVSVGQPSSVLGTLSDPPEALRQSTSFPRSRR